MSEQRPLEPFVPGPLGSLKPVLTEPVTPRLFGCSAKVRADVAVALRARFDRGRRYRATCRPCTARMWPTVTGWARSSTRQGRHVSVAMMALARRSFGSGRRFTNLLLSIPFRAGLNLNPSAGSSGS